MDKEDDNVVYDFAARRTQQRKQAGENPYENQPILEAADEITQLYGMLATRMSAEDLFIAIKISERALLTVLHSAVGEGHAISILRQAIHRALTEFTLSTQGVPDAAKVLFEDERPEREET